MADLTIVREWLEKADEDFNFASANLNEGSEFFAQICFHFQQAAEKYLKSYIIARGLPFSKVHDLLYLLKECSGDDPSFAELKEDAITLNTSYIETRYPVHWPTCYSKESAEQARIAAKNIAKKVRDSISSLVISATP